MEFVRDIVTTAVPTSANVKNYATIVHEKAVLLRMIQHNGGNRQRLLPGQRHAGGHYGGRGEEAVPSAAEP